MPALAGGPELKDDFGRLTAGGGETERAFVRADDGTVRRAELAGGDAFSCDGRERGAAEVEVEGADGREEGDALLDEAASGILDAEVEAVGCGFASFAGEDERSAEAAGSAALFGGAADFFAKTSATRSGFLSRLLTSTSRSRSRRTRSLSRARRFSWSSRSISSIDRMSRLSLLSARKPSSAKRLLISALPWLAPLARASVGARADLDDPPPALRLTTDAVEPISSPKIDLFSLIFRSSARVSSSFAGLPPALRGKSVAAGRE